jgi:hypothetical protein
MIFGEKDKFAVECLVTNKSASDNVIFGKIFIWLGHEKVGDESVDVVLNVPAREFNESISFSGDRQNKNLGKMTKDEVINFLDQILWEDNDPSLSIEDIINLEGEYSKYNICTNFSESFDGESIYLIETEKGERFVWKLFGEEFAREIYLENSTYERVVGDFINWYLQENPSAPMPVPIQI